MRIVITGGGSGLGSEIIDAIMAYMDSNDPQQEVTIFNLDMNNRHRPQAIYNIACDVSNATSVMDAVEELYHFSPLPYDILINCAGINEIDYIDNLLEETWDNVMNTNAKGIYLVTRAFLPHLEHGTILNIVSNASHVPMTSSLAYNASKGAAAIMTLQMARELMPTHDITVFGISPNKLAGTGMSDYIDKRVCETRDWSMQEARKYQLASLPAGAETPPEILAEFIAFLLSNKERHRFLTGTIIPYGK